MYNAELQLLREFAHFWMPAMCCHFCHNPLMLGKGLQQTFGHRRHPKVRVKLTLHHLDENRSNNAFKNLVWSHSLCHTRYHRQILLQGGYSGKESKEGQKRQEGEDVE